MTCHGDVYSISLKLPVSPAMIAGDDDGLNPSLMQCGSHCGYIRIGIYSSFSVIGCWLPKDNNLRSTGNRTCQTSAHPARVVSVDTLIRDTDIVAFSP